MNTEKLKELADAKFDLNVAKLSIQERIKSELLVVHNGGMFSATMELMSFLSINDSDLVLIDNYGNPVYVNRIKLLSDLRIAYKYATNRYLNEFTKLKKVRKGSQI